MYLYFSAVKCIGSDLKSRLFVHRLDETLRIGVVYMPLPDGYHLAQNHPNPFNASTTLTVGLPSGDIAILTLHDLLGREVDRIDLGWRQAGHHDVTWPPADLPSGLSFAPLSTRAGSTEAGKNPALNRGVRQL